MQELTFEERDRLEADRRAKARELVERLAQTLSREFSYRELVFIWTNDAVRVEAWEQARLRTKK